MQIVLAVWPILAISLSSRGVRPLGRLCDRFWEQTFVERVLEVNPPFRQAEWPGAVPDRLAARSQITRPDRAGRRPESVWLDKFGDWCDASHRSNKVTELWSGDLFGLFGPGVARAG